MYISDMTHFLNKQGNIPKEIPGEAGELARFFAMVVDLTSKTNPSILTPTGLRCFRKGCPGIIISTIKPNKEEIHWYCPECENEGVISHWQKTKWDNTNHPINQRK
jgi:hypothetical protein